MDLEVAGLKPCPFCGGQIALVPITRKIGDDPSYYFACDSCFIESRISLSKEQTIAHVNSRVELEP